MEANKTLEEPERDEIVYTIDNSSTNSNSSNSFLFLEELQREMEKEFSQQQIKYIKYIINSNIMTDVKQRIETWIKRHQEFNGDILSDSNINKELGSELDGNFENYLASADLENSKTELEVKRTLTKAIKNILERERAEKKLTGEIAWGFGESDCPEHRAWIVRLKDKLAELEEIKNIILTYETVQTTINNLESLANADNEKAEKIVWEENKEVNQKLLTDLLAKLATITPPQPETEKYGEDYSALQPEQQHCRQTICQNWNKSEKDYSHYRLYICHYCPQEFAYDTNLEFLSAKKKAESELTNHQNNCPQKNETEQVKQIKQTKWKETRKSKESFFYTCQYCWGKIRLDKAINDYLQAKKQGLADFAYHQEQECNKPQAEKLLLFIFHLIGVVISMLR